jgi:signal transduction histidine kinase
MLEAKNLDQSEQLRESLLDLARANNKEREARTEAEALLAGLYALTNYDNREKMFDSLLEILRTQLGFDKAFILAAKAGKLEVVATTSAQFSEISWPAEKVAQRMALGRPLAFFDVRLAPEWQSQSEACRQGVFSGLHLLIRDYPNPAFFICTHPQRGFFAERHRRLASRFAPLASQALINLDNRLELENANYRLQLEIKERQKAQAQVVNSSKMAALGEMAGGIAHEINTPLGALILNAEMILKKIALLPGPNEGLLKHANSVIQIGQRISKIINGLKTFSRDAKNDRREAFSVRELIEKTVELCGEKFKSHGVRLTIDDRNLDTRIDGKIIQLSQTLLNLLNNSYDAIQDFSEKWIEIRASASDSFIDIRVVDCGNGISPQNLEKLFQPFFTTKAIGKGTGLGLSISKNIVKNHGGDLFYDEKSPHTCFVIRLANSQAGRPAA